MDWLSPHNGLKPSEQGPLGLNHCVAAQPKWLLDLDCRASFFQLLLDVFNFVFRDAFFDR